MLKTRKDIIAIPVTNSGGANAKTIINGIRVMTIILLMRNITKM